MDNNNGNPELDRFKLRVLLILITILLILSDIGLTMSMREVSKINDRLENIIEALDLLEKIIK